MVRKDYNVPTFKDIPEVFNRLVDDVQLTVVCRQFLNRRRNFSTEES